MAELYLYFCQKCGASMGLPKDVEAIVDKLPVYADTGETFVLGVDKAWVVVDCMVRQVISATYYKTTGWEFEVFCSAANGEPDTRILTSSRAYSTEAAAIEAQKAQTTD